MSVISRDAPASSSKGSPLNPSPTWIGRRPKLVLMVADMATIVLAILFANSLLVYGAKPMGLHDHSWQFLTVSALSLPVWPAVLSNQRLYNTRFIGRRIDEIRRIVNAVILGVVGVALAGYFVGYLAPRSGLAILFVVAVVFLAAEREGARHLFGRLRKSGRMVRPVIIAGANPEGREMAAMLASEPWIGYRVLGFVDDTSTDPQPVAGIPLLGKIADADEIVRANHGASVIVAASAIESATTNRLVRDLLKSGVHVELSSTLRDIASQRLTVRPLGRFPVVYVEPVQRDGWRAAAKRGFDIAGALAGLLVTAPIAVAAAIAVRLDSPGEILFRQTRVGRDSKPFKVLKFRSMVADAEVQLTELAALNEADGPLFKMRSDPRVTRVGKFIRKTSIDELPQLWNVLRGEMSLVGPRPALPHETEAWDALLTERLRVKPGITGMWQVNGRSDTSFEDYTRLDLYYVDNWSLLTDLAILLKTVPVVLTSRGAS